MSAMKGVATLLKGYKFFCNEKLFLLRSKKKKGAAIPLIDPKVGFPITKQGMNSGLYREPVHHAGGTENQAGMTENWAPSMLSWPIMYGSCSESSCAASGPIYVRF